MPASSSVSPVASAQAPTTMKKTSFVRHTGMPVAIPAATLSRPITTAGHRDPAGNTNHTDSSITRAVAIAKPLKTERPTAAE